MGIIEIFTIEKWIKHWDLSNYKQVFTINQAQKAVILEYSKG
jgi:hypothetical protein